MNKYKMIRYDDSEIGDEYYESSKDEWIQIHFGNYKPDIKGKPIRRLIKENVCSECGRKFDEKQEIEVGDLVKTDEGNIGIITGLYVDAFKYHRIDEGNSFYLFASPKVLTKLKKEDYYQTTEDKVWVKKDASLWGWNDRDRGMNKCSWCGPGSITDWNVAPYGTKTSLKKPDWVG